MVEQILYLPKEVTDKLYLERLYRVACVYAHYELICEISGTEFNTSHLDKTLLDIKYTNEVCSKCGRVLFNTEVAMFDWAKECGICIGGKDANLYKLGTQRKRNRRSKAK